MRLIDADALKYRREDYGGYDDIGIEERKRGILYLLEKDIATAPTIDAVPVVRCKDCKHRDAEEGFCEGRGWPMQLVPDDGFCDKGKRSEE